jgi:hypothetical protein
MPEEMGRLFEKPYQRIASSRAIRCSPRRTAFCWASEGFAALGVGDR